MTHSLFRPEVSNAKRSQWLGSVVLIQPLAFHFYAVFALSSVGCMLAVLCFGSYTKRVSANGLILPTTGLIKIQSPSNALILERRVQEGQSGEVGEVLYLLSNDATLVHGELSKEAAILKTLDARHVSLQEELKQQAIQSIQHTAQLTQQIQSLQAEIVQLDQELSTQQKRMDSIQQQAKKQQQLVTQGYSTALALQQKQDEILDQQARMQSMQRNKISLQRELSVRQAELSNTKQQGQREQNQTQRQSLELDHAKMQNQFQFAIAAPQAGIVSSILAEPGQYTGNNTLLTIVPSKAEFEAQVFVPSRAAGFIKVGQSVRLRFAAYPYQKFGQYLGKVTLVAKTPLQPSELPVQFSQPSSAYESLYRVKISLAQQNVQVYGKNENLIPGMLFDADILQEERSLWEWILEPIFSLKGRFS